LLPPSAVATAARIKPKYNRHAILQKLPPGLYATAKRVAADGMDELATVLPPTDEKKVADIGSWKPWQVPTTGMNVQTVIEFCASQISTQTAAERDADPADPADPEDAQDPASTKEKHGYKPWQWEVFVSLQRSMPGKCIRLCFSLTEIHSLPSRSIYC
jgi:hypothetical protein